MFGVVTEWYYRWLGGIRPDSTYSGSNAFILNPSMPEELDYLKASYYSTFGKIVSNWRKNSS